MLEALEKIIEQTLERTLAKFNLERKPEPPPAPAAAAPARRQGRVLSLDYGAGPSRELTELEKVQRSFAFLREHGGIIAEARRNQWGEFEWRRYR